MSAADRMVVRTRDGSYRSFPRRTALGLISRGQATAATADAPARVDPAPAAVDPLGPHGDEYQEPQAWYGIDVIDPPHLHFQTVTEPRSHGDEYQEKRDQLLTDMAAALDVPVEVLTPIEDGVNHWSAADDSAEMAAALGISDMPTEPRGNASRQEWADYASDLGVIVTDGMTRNKIRDAAQDAAQSLARLPQPALPGGRLETPEDEPVTEESVTDDEDPGTE